MVASGTTRRNLTSTVISYTYFFSPSIEFPGLDPPGKGGVEEMPVPK